jgi:hypothetical protein
MSTLLRALLARLARAITAYQNIEDRLNRKVDSGDLSKVDKRLRVAWVADILGEIEAAADSLEEVALDLVRECEAYNIDCPYLAKLAVAPALVSESNTDRAFAKNLLEEVERIARTSSPAAFAGAKASTNPTFVPTDKDIEILEVLGRRQTRCKADVLAVPGVGEGVKKTRLPILERAGLVDRAEGKRRGWAISPTGRTLLASSAHAKRT